MTVSEIKSRFLLLLDAAYSQAAPGFEDYQISEFLDKAQKDFVDQVAKAKIYDDIYQIIEVAEATITPSSYDNRMYHFEIDNYFPDFGEIEYLVVIQYYINDVFYCNYINESTTRTFFVPRYQLQDARLHIVRTVIDKDGYVINQIESNLVRVTDCIIR